MAPEAEVKGNATSLPFLERLTPAALLSSNFEYTSGDRVVLEKIQPEDALNRGGVDDATQDANV